MDWKSFNAPFAAREVGDGFAEGKAASDRCVAESQRESSMMEIVHSLTRPDARTDVIAGASQDFMDECLRAQQRTSAITATARDSHGFVEVTVNAAGVVQETRVLSARVPGPSPSALSTGFTEAARSAARDAKRQVDAEAAHLRSGIEALASRGAVEIGGPSDHDVEQNGRAIANNLYGVAEDGKGE